MVTSFVHIPKNAGTTIRKLLNPPKLVWEQHACLQQIWDETPTEKFNNTKFIAICREPLDRLHSWWQYHRNWEGISHFYDKDFNDWVEKGCPHHWLTSPHFVMQYGTRYSAYLYAPVSQTKFLQVNGKFPENLSVYRQENLLDDWEEIARYFGKKSVPLQKMNKSKRGAEWMRGISDQTQTRVMRLCQDDYQNFYQ